MISARREDRIASVRCYAVRGGVIPLCLVKVTTRAGIVGWGEAALWGRASAIRAIVRDFEPLLIGEDPFDRGWLWQRLYRSHYQEGGHEVPAALSAVDIALHDIAAKKLDVQVVDLIGGRQRKWVPLFATVAPGGSAAVLEGVARLREEGWRAIRLLPVEVPGGSVYDPHESVIETATLVRAVRDVLPRNVLLGLDFHHRLNPVQMKLFVELVGPDSLDFLEEPIRAESVAAYSSLRQHCSIPLAIGEEFSSKWDFLPYFAASVIDYARIDICKAGGFSEAVKIAGMAEVDYVDVMLHNPLGPVGTAAHAHFALACPNFSYLEGRESPGEDLDIFNWDVYPTMPKREGDRLYVADAAGLGVEVNEEMLREHDSPYAAPAVTRPDGSVTNC